MIDTACWRVTYGLERDAHELHAYWQHWERGVPADCVLAIKSACDQIDNDTALLRQALEALQDDCIVQVGPHAWERRSDLAIAALRERLGEEEA